MNSEQKTTLLLVIVVVSLLLNIYNYQALRAQHNIITIMRNESAGRGNMGSQLDYAISDLRTRIDNIGKDMRWVTFTELQPYNPGTTREAVRMSFAWTLREVGKSSEVYLLLKPYESEEWERVRASRNEGGVFRAVATLKPEARYQFSFEEVTATTIKSNEPQGVPEHLYQPRNLILHPRSSSNRPTTGTSSYRYELWEDRSGLDIYTVKKYSVKYYYADGQIKVVPTAVEESTFLPHRTTAVMVDLEIDKTVSSIALQAEFADGHVTEVALPTTLDRMMPIELKLK